ncbi:MAG TPA: 2-dehydropantoate 2-reductase [Bacteroidia bacterium]|nr:2-dehydropantoate 2-reductase [Bacteroidia bacterium]
MTKIAIAGIGGVGGYLGGMLAKHFESSTDVEIYFIARGENEKAIKQNGLRVETTKGNFVTHPKLTTSNPNETGIVNFLIYCTKSYDLEESIEQFKPCINKDTVILPLLNGVDSSERIKTILPENEVWDGCIYIVSQLSEPGLIKETGNINTLFFGSANGTEAKLKKLESIFKESGISATLSGNIQQEIWKKFIFLSPIATLTSYLDANFGVILSSEEHKKTLWSLLHEIKAVADAKKISLPDDIIQKTMGTMLGLQKETTTSMHRNFQKGKKTELESLAGYVVRLGKQLNTATPTYEMIYEKLKNR